jgi:hypothetical protein
MITLIGVNILGYLVFLFLFWRKLKEDYSAQPIFTTGFYILLSFLIFFFIAFKFLFAYWFWFSLLGIGVGLTIGILRFRLKLYEVIEATICGVFIWLALVFLNDSVIHSSIFSFAGFAVAIAIVGIYYFLDGHYHTFTWYKSGKIGFAGLTSAGIFFLVRAIIAGFYPFVLSFSGKYELYLSAIASFIFFLLTYNLARTKI